MTRLAAILVMLALCLTAYGSTQQETLMRRAWGVRGAAVASWTPADITTYLWLDASDTSTIVSSNNLVSQWNDKSGNSRNELQNTDANKPRTGGEYKLNGKNLIYFDGVNDTMVTAALTISQSNETYAVYVITNSNAIAAEADLLSSDSPRVVLRPRWASGGSLVYAGSVLNGLPSILPPVCYGTNCWSVVLNGASSIGRTNFAVNVSGNAGTAAWGQVRLAKQVDGTAYGQVFYAEVIISPVLSGADRTNMQTYLKSKWGLSF